MKKIRSAFALVAILVPLTYASGSAMAAGPAGPAGALEDGELIGESGLARDLPTPTYAVDSPPVDLSDDPVTRRYRDNIDNHLDVIRFREAIAAEVGRRYGGLWIEGVGPESVAVVGLVDPSEDDRELVAEEAGDQGERVLIEPVAFSYAELRAYGEKVAEILGEREMLRMWVDEPTNTLLVEAKLSADDEKAVRDSVPAAALTLRQPDEVRVARHADRSHWSSSSFEGGLALIVPGNNACTTGWHIYNAVFGAFGTTAGHCSPFTGGAVSAPGGTYSGSIAANTWTNTAPAESDTATFVISTASPARVFTGVNAHRPNCCPYGSSGVPQGTSICFQGITSGANNCGAVNSGLHNEFYNGRTTKNMQCFDAISAGGDSGGSAYRVTAAGSAKAAGTLTAGGSSDSCFDSIYRATTALSSALVTSASS